MKLYRISDKGELVTLPYLEFDSHDVYLIDDQEKSSIYIWVGLEVPQYMKDITAAYARRFDKERGVSTKIHIMKEKREFGSFLAMIESLRKGEIPGKTIERRPELILQGSSQEASSTLDLPSQKEIISEEQRIVSWLNQLRSLRANKMTEIIQEEATESFEEVDLETQIREAAYYLSLEKYTYNDLCWLLGEKIQNVNLGMPSLEDIRIKAEEVFHSSSTYDELCWLNAEMDILIIKGFLEKKKTGFDY
jgi:hypothetical protein